jgi:uncharacterized membrane protein
MSGKTIRLAALWFIMGEQYFIMEAIYRAFRGERAHIAMIAVGGLCGITVGGINQCRAFYNLPVWVQSVIGTVVTLFIEFISGVVLNIALRLEIWDYSHLWGNLYGQICVQFAAVWLLIMPLAIWLEDSLRWGFGWNGKKYSLSSIYKDFFTGR